MECSICGIIKISANSAGGFILAGCITAGVGLAVYAGVCWINKKFFPSKERKSSEQSDCANINNTNAEQNTSIKQPLPPAKTFAEELKGSNPEDVEKNELLGKFIHASDICLLCAPIDAGKSILTTQIGFDLATGYATKLIPNSKTRKPQQVFLYDKEGRSIDLIHRYAKMDECTLNSKNILRPPCSDINNLEKLLVDIQGRVRTRYDDCIVIVDNITAFNESKAAKCVNNFYNELALLRAEQEKKKLKVTFLLVTHTNKTSVSQSGLCTQDILGSGNLSNLANSILYLEKTGTDNERKLRCGKNKTIPDGENGLIIRFVNEPYLHFEYVCYANEKAANRLKENCEKKKNEQVHCSESTGKKKARGKKVTDEEILKMKKLQKEGLSINEIAKQMGRCRKTIGEYLSKGITTSAPVNSVTC